jgi:hypothetical protein
MFKVNGSEITGEALDRFAESVGLRRGYERETDRSLQERIQKRVRNLNGETLYGDPVSVSIHGKSRYDIAREQEDIPPEFEKVLHENFWDLTEPEVKQKRAKK